MGHKDILAFAEHSVNLHRRDVAKFRKQVNNLRDQLASYISANPDYVLIKMLSSGSVAKGTALKTIDDMDVAVYVRRARAPETETQLLEWLLHRLREVYPTMAADQFRVSEHCIRVSFRGSGLDVDVVPVLYEGGPDDRGYIVTKDTGQWVETSIPLHLKFIRKRKDRHPDQFAQIVRLIKWWVRERRQVQSDFHLKSFLVELMMAHLADYGLDLSNCPLALERFFAFVVGSELRERIAFDDYYPSTSLPTGSVDRFEVYDPVNPENNVASGYGESHCRAILEAAHDALDALNEAHHATTKERAVALWRLVLGPTFGG